MKTFFAVMTALALFTASSVASGQVVYRTYSPVVAAAPVVVESPTVVQSPVVVESWRPVVTNYRYDPPVSTPGFTAYTSNYGNYSAAVSYYAPATAPAVTYSPVTTAYSPVVTETVTAYSPVVTTAYSPVVTYSPVVRSYYTPMIVSPRYVPGEPVRNFFRALSPYR